MVYMNLKPSEIYFSQDSINNVFDKNCSHSYRPIGQTLDELCEGRCRLTNIPTIRVMRKDNKWFTADNRRLWVFEQLERLGKCTEVRVMETGYIPCNKFTTYNGGVSIYVRGNPGGYWYRRPDVVAIQRPKEGPREPSPPTKQPINVQSQIYNATKLVQMGMKDTRLHHTCTLINTTDSVNEPRPNLSHAVSNDTQLESDEDPSEDSNDIPLDAVAIDAKLEADIQHNRHSVVCDKGSDNRSKNPESMAIGFESYRVTETAPEFYINLGNTCLAEEGGKQNLGRDISSDPHSSGEHCGVEILADLGETQNQANHLSLNGTCNTVAVAPHHIQESNCSKSKAIVAAVILGVLLAIIVIVIFITTV